MIEEGVLVLLNDEFRAKLDTFTLSFDQARVDEQRTLPDPTVYSDLPDSERVRGEHEWQLRVYDLAVIRRLIPQHPQLTILDIGAWNGWLANRLAEWGHRVTAIDYFVNEHDGLRAKKFYATDWRAIQMNVSDLSPLDEFFDVIIVNRCLQFFPDPFAYLIQVKQKLAPNGIAIFTGLALYRDTRSKAQELDTRRKSYRARYKLELFLQPTKGYFDLADKARLLDSGVRLIPYPQLRLLNLAAWLIPTMPQHHFGVWRAE